MERKRYRYDEKTDTVVEIDVPGRSFVEISDDFLRKWRLEQELEQKDAHPGQRL